MSVLTAIGFDDIWNEACDTREAELRQRVLDKFVLKPCPPEPVPYYNKLMYAPQDPISSLHGCGLEQLAKLRKLNIHKLEDLVLFKSGTDGPPFPEFESLRISARTLLEKRINKHSWRGLHMRVRTRSGRVLRVLVGDLVVRAHSVVLETTCTTRQKTHVKYWSPVALAAFHNMWVNNDIVSDNSDSEDVQKPFDYVVPHLQIESTDTSQFSTYQLFGIRTVIQETNLLRHV